jgi:hypothetical protein
MKFHNSEKVVSINEIRYKKYGHVNYGNAVPVYKPVHKINYKRNIRREMIKGYYEMLTNYYSKRGGE